jgi:Tol biopolymer transport system component
MVGTLLLLPPLVAALLAGATPTSAARGEGVRTLAVVGGGVRAVAQDGPRIAWLDCMGLHVRRVPQRTLRHGAQCRGRFEATKDTTQLALAGTRALWTTTPYYGHNKDVDVFTQSPRARRPIHLDSDTYGPGGGRVLGPVAGDGDTLVYSALTTWTPFGLAGPFIPYHSFLGESATFVVRGRSARRIPSAPGGAALAAASGLVAIAPAGSSHQPPRDVLGPCTCHATPDWSPDGTRIAYASGQSGDGVSIFTVRSDGTDVRRVTGGGAVDYAPAWSPDGTRIAFQRSTMSLEAGEIHIVDAATGAEQRLGEGVDPAWSPDGATIAAARRNQGGIVLFDAEAGAETWLLNLVARTTGVHSPAWSPDGSMLAFLRGHEIFVVRPGDAAPRREAKLTTTLRRRDALAWSPDGSMVAFETDDGLGVVAADGSGERLLSVRGRHPSWSPDGQRLAVTRSAPERDREGDTPHTHVYATSLDGTTVARITPHVSAPAPPVEVRRAATGALVSSFAPGGVVKVALSARRAAVLRNDDGRWVLEIYRVSDGRLVRRAGGPRITPGGPGLALAGDRVAFTSGRSIRVLDVRTGRTRTVATLNGKLAGFALEDRRLVWGENVASGRGRGFGRIRAVTVR